jgi:hypothetical protein
VEDPDEQSQNGRRADHGLSIGRESDEPASAVSPFGRGEDAATARPS